MCHRMFVIALKGVPIEVAKGMQSASHVRGDSAGFQKKVSLPALCQTTRSVALSRSERWLVTLTHSVQAC